MDPRNQTAAQGATGVLGALMVMVQQELQGATGAQGATSV